MESKDIENWKKIVEVIKEDRCSFQHELRSFRNKLDVVRMAQYKRILEISRQMRKNQDLIVGNSWKFSWPENFHGNESFSDDWKERKGKIKFDLTDEEDIYLWIRKKRKKMPPLSETDIENMILEEEEVEDVSFAWVFIAFIYRDSYISK